MNLKNREVVFSFLDKLNIEYKIYEHPAVFTTAESEKYTAHIEGADTKNLFLRNKKGTCFYLVTLPSSIRGDLKKIANTVGEKKLTFASDESLLKYLGLTAGSVSPFGLINDTSRTVNFFLYSDLLKADKLGFHPNDNTATIIINQDDFQLFLREVGNNYQVID